MPVSGDANQSEDSVTDNVRGLFGNPQLNDNGRLLFDFCGGFGCNPLRIMSTYFQHKVYETWQHNLTKQWHQIDHVLARHTTAQLFTDVKVMTGLDCDSDHRLLSVSLRVMNKCKQPWGNRPQQSTSVRIPRLEVSRLQDPDIQDKLNTKMLDLAHADLASDAELWQYALRKSAEHACGDVDTLTRPVWQQDNAHELAELANKK